MTSSPKRSVSSSSHHHHSHQHQSRPSRLSLCFLAMGVVGFVFGSISMSRPISGYRCRDSNPDLDPDWRSQRVVSLEPELDPNRRKVMGMVGVQTGFGSKLRRKALRSTWMPSDPRGLQRLEESTGLAFRFVIGKTRDQSKMSGLQKEVAEYNDFMLLDIDEQYSNLPYKTVAFFKAAYGLFDAEFYVKADDDIYLRPDRLSVLLAKERSHPFTYLGCMKRGPVFSDPKLKWYEPQGYLLGKEYFLHAYGPIYALSADVVASIITLKNNSFRMFSNEDVTIGAWMLAMNVNHEDNRALCQPDCTSSSIAVWDIPKCSGLCNPEKKLLALHQRETCSRSPTLVSHD